MEISDISEVIENNHEDEHEESDEHGKSRTSGDPQNPSDKESKHKKSQLNNYVAITVVVFVTFMGICKVKSDNVVQAMQKAQADRIDTWSFYQARNIRAEVAKSTVAQLHLQALSQQQPKIRAEYEKEIAKYEAIATKQSKEKDALQQQAKDAEKQYEQLNVHDDQFDLSEAAFALAIAMLAMTSLTQKNWLYGAAMVPATFGLFMGLAGLLNWDYHPDAMTKLLSNKAIHQPYKQAAKVNNDISYRLY